MTKYNFLENYREGTIYEVKAGDRIFYCWIFYRAGNGTYNQYIHRTSQKLPELKSAVDAVIEEKEK